MSFEDSFLEQQQIIFYVYPTFCGLKFPSVFSFIARGTHPDACFFPFLLGVKIVSRFLIFYLIAP